MTAETTPPYRIVIGLEVHVQLLTRTKLFCGCSTKFGLPPNSATCPVCTGLPGALPVMNRHAFQLALRAALALNCRIASFTKWDRKNYYYPDLPKNYQISQYDLPFSQDGYLELENGTGSKRVGIIRAHLEEDAGKMLHDEHGGARDSLVDLNRTGTPLLEIVSKPDIETPEQAKAYLEEIRLLLREIDVSDCEMQEGSLRCDANINIHVPLSGQASGVRSQGSGERSQESGGQEPELFAATPIVEVKNLNSFRGVERAMNYEAERQYQEFQSKFGAAWQIDADAAKPFGGYRVAPVCEVRGGRLIPVAKATAGWDDRRGQTAIQRRKEEAADYRYFPDPDLVPVFVSKADLDQARAELGELPALLRQRLQEDYGLSAYEAGVLVRHGRPLAAYFEQAAGLCQNPKATANWVTNEILQTLKERKLAVKDFPIPPASLADLINMVKAKGLNKQIARAMFADMLQGTTVKDALAKFGDALIDKEQLREMVQRAVAANAKAVADFKKGKTKAADAIKGAVMRETKGRANMEMVQELLLEELNKN
ncbi:MAG: Asp-tRNA(Asn)/Glu-tRNA(Gln) amidotransferase subunit GatB [Gemmataceae bacterium]|nr:Asp-tRNA(Asn)/Glu-tRNA(Gln) amidotransferase subunit GatB [Gemmataceae bacterium]MCI0740391.1 Asp-tRNA(Asn)/Glu-tRNA(Gln) amidotransferase subunit GatB [Gemmataceae bacterium]